MAKHGDVPMVGRTEPRRRLTDAIAASATGRRGVVLVSGEAGMGKTTLMRAAVEASPGSPVVGWGTCWHGEGAPGFWPWMQAFDDLVRVVGDQDATRAAGRDAKLLRAVVRSFGTAIPDAAASVPDGDRVLLLDAAVRWLEALADDRQVIIVLDDLQWADPSSLDLLEQVAAAAPAARLLVIGGYRHDEIDTDHLPRLTQVSSHADRIHIGGLPPHEVRDLVIALGGSTITEEQAATLHRRTGGHPLFVTELARLAALGDDSLPAVVTEAVARRLESLPATTRTALDAAGVLGNRILVDVIAHATGTTPIETIRALEPAHDAGVVRTGPDSDRWFSHDLFRETLYDALGVSRQVELHALISQGLELRAGRGGHIEPGDLARHTAAAITVTGVDPAIRWALAAAVQDRRRSAFSEAGFHLRRARTAAMDAGLTIPPATLVAVLRAEAEDVARAGSPDVARTILHDAAAIAPDPGAQAEIALAVQRLGARFATRRDEMIAQLDDALAAVAGNDLLHEARLTAALARELQHSVPEDRMRAAPLSERALTLGRTTGDDATLAECLLARHDILWGPGTGAERAELGREIAEVGARLHDTDRHAEGLLLQANGLLESGSPAFRPVLDRWFAILEQRDQPRDRYMVLTRRVALALIEGRTDDADALMHEAAVVGATIHEPDTGNVLMSHRVALARALDDPGEHRRLAVDAVAHWTGTPVHAHAVAAGALAAAGDLDAAAREVAMVADAGGWRNEGSYLRSVLVAHLAAAAVALGDRPLCEELLDEVEPLTGSCGVNGAVVAFAGPFDHTAGILAAALGDHERAALLLDRSTATARRLGAVVWTRAGEAARRRVGRAAGSAGPAAAPPGEVATLKRTGGIWAVEWRGESGSLRHVKGIADIVELIRRPGTEIPALQLAGSGSSDSSTPEQVIDLEALGAYRLRLDRLDRELDQAGDDADIGRVEALQDEREALLAEVRRSTGLGGRVRTVANDPAERARKAVSARIRDAITRLEAVAPQLAAHLDRSIRTGLRCCYDPAPGEARVEWQVTR